MTQSFDQTLLEPTSPTELSADLPGRQLTILGNKLNVFDIIALGIALWGLLLRLKIGPLTYDDSYISFRYALNLANGHGLVYNIGQHVMGASCPLWILILALLAKCGFHIVWASFVTSSFLDFASTLFVYSICRKLLTNPLGALSGALFFAIGTQNVMSATSGMETSLYLFLILASFASIAHDKPVAATVFASFVMITRPEGILILPAVLTVIPVVTGKRLSLRYFVIAGLPLTIWCVFSILYYGSLIPLSVSAKAVTIPHFATWSDAAVNMLQYMIDPIILPSVVVKIKLFFLAMTTFKVVGLIVLLKSRTVGRAIVLWLLLFFGAWAIVDKYMFYWYYVPLVIPSCICFGVGVVETLTLLNAFARRLSSGKAVDETSHNAINLRSNLLAYIILFIIGAYMTPLFLRVTKGEVAGSRVEIRAREDLYAQSATWINENFGVNTPVCIGEIGAFGYTHPGEIIDFGALVTPGMAQVWKGRNGSQAQAAALDKFEPSLFIGGPPFNGTPEYKDFFQHYRQIMKWQCLSASSRCIMLYRRY